MSILGYSFSLLLQQGIHGHIMDTSMKAKEVLEKQFKAHADTVSETRASVGESFPALIEICEKLICAAGKILFLGNGGSASVGSRRIRRKAFQSSAIFSKFSCISPCWSARGPDTSSAASFSRSNAFIVFRHNFLSSPRREKPGAAGGEGGYLQIFAFFRHLKLSILGLRFNCG